MRDWSSTTARSLDATGRAAGPYAGGRLPYAFRDFRDRQDLELHLFASLEAQVAAISDDIAYDCHDIEDGLRARLLSLDDLEDQPMTGAAAPCDSRRSIRASKRRASCMSWCGG